MAISWNLGSGTYIHNIYIHCNTVINVVKARIGMKQRNKACAWWREYVLFTCQIFHHRSSSLLLRRRTLLGRSLSKSRFILISSSCARSFLERLSEFFFELGCFFFELVCFFFDLGCFFFELGCFFFELGSFTFPLCDFCLVLLYLLQQPGYLHRLWVK